jgi:hypothetical protein
MVDRFTIEQFENALPVNKKTGEKMWESLGLMNGEYTFLVPIHEFASILIRSSIDRSGVSADSGEDSIRPLLVDPKTYQPVGSKLSVYITRVNGWETRLTDQLRKLFQLGRKVKSCPCGGTVKILKVKKDGPNKGRFFSSCSADFNCKLTPFEWLEDEFQPKKFQGK